MSNPEGIPALNGVPVSKLEQIMSDLELELSNLENSIRAAVVSGDEFQYHKLLRAKTETESKLFFRRQSAMKAEIESLKSERQAAKAVIDDLTKDLALQAEKVRQLRSQAYDEQEKHNQLSLKIHLLRTKLENDKDSIWELKKQLNLLADKKLNPEKFDESGNLKKPLKEKEENERLRQIYFEN